MFISLVFSAPLLLNAMIIVVRTYHGCILAFPVRVPVCSISKPLLSGPVGPEDADCDGRPQGPAAEGEGEEEEEEGGVATTFLELSCRVHECVPAAILRTKCWRGRPVPQPLSFGKMASSRRCCISADCAQAQAVFASCLLLLTWGSCKTYDV